MNISGQNILVLGGGRSGQASAALATHHGARVVLCDQHRLSASARTALEQLGVVVHDECSTLTPYVEVETAILSPGISIDSEWLEPVKQHQVPILSEMEFGWNFLQGQMLAVTGSLGKSTFCTLSVLALQAAGHSAVACGNIGIPVSAIALRPERWDWVVIEVSSFQLESVRDFRPDVAVLLNCFPNHLDRHGNIESYRECKMRLFQSQCSGDYAVLPKNLAKKGEVDIDLEGQLLTFESDSGNSPSQTPWKNFEAWQIAMELCGVPDSVSYATFKDFDGLPHRLEHVATIDGVRYVNDSKATCLEAMLHAVEVTEPQIHLIAGGKLKEKGFDSLKEVLARKAVNVYLIGEASDTLYEVLSEDVSTFKCDTLEKALHAARSAAKSGDTVLLSPGGSSFDQFVNFEERGEIFTQWVMNIEKVDHGV